MSGNGQFDPMQGLVQQQHQQQQMNTLQQLQEMGSKHPAPYMQSLSRGYIKDPNSSYTTQLSPQEEQEFTVDTFKGKFGPNIQPKQAFDPKSDYDYRGYWKANKSGDPNAQQNKSTLHFPDTWKTPYHKSFSAESMYADPNSAPKWKEGKDTWQLIDPYTKEVIFEEPKEKTEKPNKKKQ